MNNKFYLVNTNEIKRMPTIAEKKKYTMDLFRSNNKMSKSIDLNYPIDLVTDSEKLFKPINLGGRTLTNKSSRMYFNSDLELIVKMKRLPEEIILVEKDNCYVDYISGNKIVELTNFKDGLGLFINDSSVLRKIDANDVEKIIKKQHGRLGEPLFDYCYNTVLRRFSYIAAHAYKEELGTEVFDKPNQMKLSLEYIKRGNNR